ncbi:DUF2971 domain-containing protein [Paraglaciecola psychrophila]|uniref:DUF2971 domain-containing protein n=1 Tax=Paraglaciecola psychrophila 170 TaxID=1129794 RepID=K7AQE6_9ALTE|nr:DUF2971 domain-containing protein [Paraglaciecola psychrophila]AGH45849.1 hypothetical protein C427_3741 [Paraglaciecola psychrophila 170]GAC37530.1 hypothetical protein GPSY_1906 [Paraglaciecola psychrophila 170]
MKINEQEKPKVLFKYRDDSERTQDIIRNQKIWLSSPSQLNDPLECRIGEIPPVWEAKTIREMEQGQLMGLVAQRPFFEPPKRLFSLSERETKQWLKRFKKLTHSRKVKAMRSLYSDHGMRLSNPENIFRDMRKRLSSVGIFSLSGTSANELMWAHYGANHEGVAFGFSWSNDCKLANPRHCLPATYNREKPTFKAGIKNEVQIMAPGSGVQNVQRVSFEDDVFRSTISTKTPAWEYEKEWRYVEESHGLFDFPGILSQVVFGMRMSNERRDFYKILINKVIQNDVEYFEVVESEDLSGLGIRKV